MPAVVPALAAARVASTAHPAGPDPATFSAPAPLRTSATPVPDDIGDLVYQHNMLTTGANPRTLQSFVLDDPASPPPTIIATQNVAFLGLEYDAASGTLYGVTDGKSFGTVNTTTGAYSPIGAITGLVDANETLTGLAFVHADATIYLSTTLVSLTPTLSRLYRLDKATGAATLIGSMGVPLMIDIAVNAQGQLYGLSIDTDMLYAISPTTGAATVIGPIGYNAQFAQSIDFDKSTGRLYGWIYVGGGVTHFVRFDLATAATTSLGNPPQGEYEGAITSPLPDLIFANGFDGAP